LRVANSSFNVIFAVVCKAARIGVDVVVEREGVDGIHGWSRDVREGSFEEVFAG